MKQKNFEIDNINLEHHYSLRLNSSQLLSMNELNKRENSPNNNLIINNNQIKLPKSNENIIAGIIINDIETLNDSDFTQNELSSLNQNISNIKIKNSEQNDNIDEEKNELKKKIKELKKEIDTNKNDLNNKILFLEKEIETMKVDIIKKDSEINELKLENKKLKKIIENNQVLISEYKKKKNEYIQIMEKTSGYVDNFGNIINRVSKKLNSDSIKKIILNYNLNTIIQKGEKEDVKNNLIMKSYLNFNNYKKSRRSSSNRSHYTNNISGYINYMSSTSRIRKNIFNLSTYK
jgi:chromosome segregation ATPase